MFPRAIRAFALSATCLGMAGCASVAQDSRSRMLDIPLASTHSDLMFTITTGARQSGSCDDGTNCPTQLDRHAAERFALQVQRVSGLLQQGVQSLYPDLAQRMPELAGGRFDVYVVVGDEPSSASSANGRIALNTALGAMQPYDEWLAFVIAREMGHVISRHHKENAAASIATSVIMNILIPGSGFLKSAVTAGGSSIAASSQRAVQTEESDVIALDLLQAAGFRLRDVSLSLAVSPLLRNDSQWSRSFRRSSDQLLAEAPNKGV